MSYSGTSVPIPVGQLGLRTDDTMTSLPPNALIKANNVTLHSGRIEKALGTTKFNATALDSGAAVVAVNDWFPVPTSQRLIAVTSSGKVYRDTGDTTFSSGTSIGTIGSSATLTPDTHIVSGGSEQAGVNKKLFILTEADQVKVINGDASVLTNLALPSADWATGNYPTFGIVYQGRLCVMNSAADRHRLYFSTASDHENFTGPTFGNSRWELWQRIAATPNVDATTALQAGTATTIFTLVNNDGFIVYGVNKFSKFTMVISQAQTGAPTYTYQYWNGSAWTTLTMTTTPVYTATGTVFAEFSPPSAWAVGDGTEGGGNNNYYAIRVLATAAPTQSVKITSLVVSNTSYDAVPPTFSIFPGENNGIKCAAVYRGLLFIFKDPFGVYLLDGRDPSTANWTVTSYASSFGVGSPHSLLQVLTDLIAANSFGSYTSLQASDAFGDFVAGDILANNLVEDYIRAQFNFAGVPHSHAVYYPEKKTAYFTGQSAQADVRDRMLMLDCNRQSLKVILDTKESPNCLALRADSENIQRPMYGDANGFVWLMDQQTYNRSGTPYLGEFQTAYTDFSFASPELGGKNKIFDFLEVNYIPTGNNNFYVDIYVDGEFRQTLTFDQVYGAQLDDFVLDEDVLAGDPSGARNRKPLKSCTGVKISFRVYNNAFNEGFKIERFIVGFRLSDEKVYSYQK